MSRAASLEAASAAVVDAGCGIPKHHKSEAVAGRLGISVDTLKKAWRLGELTPIRIGRDLIWREDEILAWLERNREPAIPVPEPERSIRRAA